VFACTWSRRLAKLLRSKRSLFVLPTIFERTYFSSCKSSMFGFTSCIYGDSSPPS
jgi:hypothetical protein